MKMNLPNKLTMIRIILALAIIFVLLFPFYSINFEFPKYMIDKIVVDTRYITAGILFILASITDFFDGYIARKYDMITDFGKMMDAIADKILVNSVLIILSSAGFINPIITVVIILRDSVVNAIRMIVGNKGQIVSSIFTGKLKTTCLMIGITLMLFYNLPFELYNIRVADFFLVLATLLSLVSGFQYYSRTKHILFEKK